MTKLLTSKTAIIYGAGGSLGSAVARTFAAEGATVHLVGRTREPLERLAAEIGDAAHLAVLDAMTMLKRRPNPQQIADTAAFLASDRAGALTSQMVNASCGLITG